MTGEVGWLPDSSEATVRAAIRGVVPGLANRSFVPNPRFAQTNPLYWSASAVVDGEFVVKYAWSEVRAHRLWREGVVLERLRELDRALPLPEVVALSRDPALLVTRLVDGQPLSWEWASRLEDPEMDEVGRQLAGLLTRLHGLAGREVLADLPLVHPTAQGDTDRLRRRYPPLVDEQRATTVLRWCGWVDDVLDAPPEGRAVLVHGDLHGYNQVWDRATPALRAVVDFEESGIEDPHFDLRYLPGNAGGPELLLSVMNAYDAIAGTRLSLERALAWNVLSHLGDAMWRTEAGAPLPGGGNAASWVDDLDARLAAFDVTVPA